jgi:hypothetical protein
MASEEPDMSNSMAQLTQPYLVYLAAHDTDVTLPIGTEFELIARVRDEYFGLYQHPKYGEIAVQTSDAIEITRLAPGMFILHGKKNR